MDINNLIFSNTNSYIKYNILYQIHINYCDI